MRWAPWCRDAKLIQTGTSGWLADLMLGAGMVLSAAGYWMDAQAQSHVLQVPPTTELSNPQRGPGQITR
ncbi:MAG: hypothetical protein ACLVJH_04410 [Faecalibacterium prausnitzii]